MTTHHAQGQMTETSAPETKAFCDAEGLDFIGYDTLGRAVDLARRLELERDGLRAQIEGAPFVDLHAFEDGIKILREALKGLSDMYVHAWVKTDGGLMMMGKSVARFEAAHAKAQSALLAKGQS